MMASGNFSFEVDRASGTFNFSFGYTIPGYADPETGEYFDQTSWGVYYAQDGGFSGGSSGYAGEGDSVLLDLGLGPASGTASYTLEFFAQNTFSGVSVNASWRIVSAAYETAVQSLAGSAGADVMLGGEGADTLAGFDGDDLLDAGAGDDSLDGGAGNDTLAGGAGTDLLDGGAGNDSYAVDDADTVLEQADGGYDTVASATDHTLAGHIEQLSLGGAAVSGTGNEGDNRIDGNAADNRLGGLGGDDDLRGAAGNDLLLGGGGADSLDGGAGQDTMRGGAGDDSYVVDSASDRALEFAGAGIDTVQVAAGVASWALGANLDILLTLGNSAFHGIGNGLRNDLSGGDGNDRLEGRGDSDSLSGGDGDDWLGGGAGADALRGGDGRDTAVYLQSTAAVTVNLASGQGAGGDAAGDLLYGVENVRGSVFDDTLTGILNANAFWGGAGDDTLFGSFGNDVLNGGEGADHLDGGDGIDTLSYGGAATAVTVNLALGTAAGGDAQGDTVLNFERVSGGAAADTLTGNDGANALHGAAGADTLAGGDGNDTLNGGAGADYLDGGAGDNTLSYAGSAAAVTIDLFRATVAGGDAEGDRVFGFDNAGGGADNDSLTGHGGANRLFGAAGDDTISGGGGDDRILGGAGADSMSGGAGTDTLSYYRSTTGSVVVNLANGRGGYGDAGGDSFSGFENVEGSARGDALYGDANANLLWGRAGFDLLDGGAGDDTLAGGLNDDTFSFGAGEGHDVVTDFRAGSGAEELLELRFGPDFDSFEEVMVVASAVGAAGEHTLLSFGADSSLLLMNVRLDALDAGDFLLF